jgi:hypothetical protein
VAREDQKGDAHFEELVQRRASLDGASDFYVKDKK